MSGKAKKQAKTRYSLQKARSESSGTAASVNRSNKAPTPTVKAAQAADPIPEVKYPYIGAEMLRIFLLTSIIFILLVASYYILR